MKLDEPSFNKLNRACFIFPLTIDDYQIDSECFMITVNKTTGYIDMLMTPGIEISAINARCRNFLNKGYFVDFR